MSPITGRPGRRPMIEELRPSRRAPSSKSNTRAWLGSPGLAVTDGLDGSLPERDQAVLTTGESHQRVLHSGAVRR
jgi:hypothetical protein